MKVFYILYFLFILVLFQLPSPLSTYFIIAICAAYLTLLFLRFHPQHLDEKVLHKVFYLSLILFTSSIILSFFKLELEILIVAGLTFASYLFFHKLSRGKGSSAIRGEGEKRAALRTDLYFDLEFSPLDEGGKMYKAVTQNVSTLGMRIYTSKELEKGRQLYFRLHIPEESWPITGKAEIVWRREVEGGFEYGLKFTEITDQDRGKLALKQGFSLFEK